MIVGQGLEFLMTHHDYPIASPTIRTLYSLWKWAMILLLLVWCASCLARDPADVEIELSVQPAGRPGLYSLTGTTNLPDQSQLTVTAIRNLRLTDKPGLSVERNTLHSILDRQIVRVEEGKWQATLNLWQVGPDGRFQESWQLDQSPIEPSLEPGSEVSFVASFDPKGQLPTSEKQEVQIPELQGSLVRFNDEGDPYVKASQTLKVSLPTGRKPPPVVKPEDENDGWGNRYEIPPDPPAPKTISPPPRKNPQTNVPLSSSEFLR